MLADRFSLRQRGIEPQAKTRGHNTGLISCAFGEIADTSRCASLTGRTGCPDPEDREEAVEGGARRTSRDAMCALSGWESRRESHSKLIWAPLEIWNESSG